MIRMIAALLLIGACTLLAAADRVVMVDGGVVEGSISRITDRGVTITVMPGGIEMVLPLARIQRYVTPAGEVVVNAPKAPPKPAARNEEKPAAKGASPAKPGTGPKEAVLTDPGGEATAHNPRFGAKELWPDELEVARSAYAREAWPKARLLVFTAPPGDWASGKRQWNDLANWSEDGQPATSPPDANTDIYFPPLEVRRRFWARNTLIARHITIAKNNHIQGTLEIHGNYWCQPGGSSFGGWSITFKGGRHAFARHDDKMTIIGEGTEEAGLLGLDSRDWPLLHHYVIVEKDTPAASVEMLGDCASGDAWRVWQGNMVVAPGARIFTGRNNNLAVRPSGTITVLSGGRLSKWDNNFKDPDIVVQGTLQAGTAERPLTRDCFVEVSFKNALGLIPEPSFPKEMDIGLIIDTPGRLLVHSAKPDEARLVFKWHGFRHYKFNAAWGEHRLSGNELATWKDAIAKTPHRIALLLQGEVRNLNGVDFRDLANLYVTDAGVPGTWKSILVEGAPPKPKEPYYAVWDPKKVLPEWRGDGVP